LVRISEIVGRAGIGLAQGFLRIGLVLTCGGEEYPLANRHQKHDDQINLPPSRPAGLTATILRQGEGHPPIFPPSGPATGSFNGLRHKSNFLATHIPWQLVTLVDWGGWLTRQHSYDS
jgi:hypothetical protein